MINFYESKISGSEAKAIVRELYRQEAFTNKTFFFFSDNPEFTAVALKRASNSTDAVFVSVPLMLHAGGRNAFLESMLATQKSGTLYFVDSHFLAEMPMSKTRSTLAAVREHLTYEQVISKVGAATVEMAWKEMQKFSETFGIGAKQLQATVSSALSVRGSKKMRNPFEPFSVAEIEKAADREKQIASYAVPYAMVDFLCNPEYTMFGTVVARYAAHIQEVIDMALQYRKKVAEAEELRTKFDTGVRHFFEAYNDV